jgi:hypothetical protein
MYSGIAAGATGWTIEPAAPHKLFRQPQVALSSGMTAVAWGAGNAILFAKSTDDGRTFGTPLKVAESGVLSLGNHRGPRIAITTKAIVITSVHGEKGRGADGDVFAWRSTDNGRTWSQGARVNDVPAAAREGLHALAANGDFVYVSWLDLRNGAMALYGAFSADGGGTWSQNQKIYTSPDGHICECCHPSLAVRDGGREIYAMFRNWLGGSRDMYLAVSKDRGRSFETQKLGEGTWPLNACPMDGGGLIVDRDGPLTVWRRGPAIYSARPGSHEVEIGPGKNVAIGGTTVAWSTPAGLMLRRGLHEAALIDAAGAFPSGAADGEHEAIAWESEGRIRIQVFPAANE